MADTETTRRLVAEFWAAAAALFADDYVLHWPQSGERIRGAANFVAINRAYPAAGRWCFTVERLVVEGEQAVTDVVVSDGAVTARTIALRADTSRQHLHLHARRSHRQPDRVLARPVRDTAAGICKHRDRVSYQVILVSFDSQW